MNKPHVKRTADGTLSDGVEPNTAFTGWPELLSASVQINTEVAGFISRRFSQDMALPGRIASSRTAEDISQTYTDFFKTASQDYADELQKLTELVSEVSPLAPTGFPLFGLAPGLAAKAD